MNEKKGYWKNEEKNERKQTEDQSLQNEKKKEWKRERDGNRIRKFKKD